MRTRIREWLEYWIVDLAPLHGIIAAVAGLEFLVPTLIASIQARAPVLAMVGRGWSNTRMVSSWFVLALSVVGVYVLIEVVAVAIANWIMD